MNEVLYDVRNGWRLYQHPAFRAPFDALTAEVEGLREKLDDEAFSRHPTVRLLARIRKLILDDIPGNPAAKSYDQGNTLGTDHRHWRRAKFNERFRLFFRFRSDVRIIVYAWLNDENTLRTRGARNDVYAAFARRLTAGDPPDSWDELVTQSGG